MKKIAIILPDRKARLPDGGTLAMCQTPDGRIMSVTDADLEGFDTMALANVAKALDVPAFAGVAIEGASGRYVTPSGAILSEVEASTRGFVTVARREIAAAELATGATAPAPVQADPAPAPAKPLPEHATAILALPEAASRPAAAVSLALNPDAKDMDPAKASRLLRSLPVEAKSTMVEDDGRATPRANAPLTGKAAFTVRSKIERAAREAELKTVRGTPEDISEAKNLAYAIRLMDAGSTIESACDIARVDLNSFR